MEIAYTIQPQGAVLDAYYRCTDRVQLIRGPLGSGKTTTSVLKALRVMSEQKPNRQGIRTTRGMCVRNTYSDLFTTTIPDWLDVFGDLGQFVEGGRKPPFQRIEFDLNDETRVECEVWFVAFDRPEHVKKARGLQLTWIWANEIKELTKAVIDMLDLRHGRYPKKNEGGPTWHGIFGDYNSPDEDHWLYRLAEEDRPKGWSFFAQPGGLVKDDAGKWQVNPYAENIEALPDNYYIAGMEGKAEDWIAVNLANEYGFVQTGKPVHPWYIDSLHCREEEYIPKEGSEIVLGFDFGRTPACAMIQKQGDGGWICFDEFCATDMSAVSFAPELSRYILSTYPGITVKNGYGDPAGEAKNQSSESTPIEIIKANKIPCRPTATNNPIARRSAIENPLKEITMTGRPRLQITKKCKLIRKGLAGKFAYRRVQIAGDERYTDEPDKNAWSHPVEALEYALQGEGEGLVVKRVNNMGNDYSDWSIPVNA